MYSATLHFLPFPALFINKEGQIVETNRAAKKLMVNHNMHQGVLFSDIFHFLCSVGENQSDASIVGEILAGNELLAEYVTLKSGSNTLNFIANTLTVRDKSEQIKGIYCFFLQIPKKGEIKYQFEILSSLTQTIACKCAYTKAHSNRVAHLSLYIGIKMGLSNEQLKLLFLSALLHDIGKIGISEQILNKEGPLTEGEFQRIKGHSLIGARIIYPVFSLKPLAPIILYHHERFDGRGYPCGLKGETIPLLSRIVTVADAFEAMTFDRCYRKKMSLDSALLELHNNAGSQFDPQIVKVFVENISHQSNFFKKQCNKVDPICF